MRARKFRSFTLPLILSVAITAGALLCYYAFCGLYPFGEDTVSWCDMNQQVVPLLLDFKDILAGKSSFLYSLQNAGGINFIGVFFFFLASPFSFLVVFVPKSMMLQFMNILVLLKMCTCSFTACLYLLKHETRPVYALLLCFFYSFSGYTMLFYQNIIWLDCMYLFPLLLQSFEYLLAKKQSRWYILCISAMMVVQYYIGYMVVLFTLIYFGLILFIITTDNRRRIAYKFVTGSLCAAALTCCVWLPSLLQYLSSGRTSSLKSSLMTASFFTDAYTVLPVLLPSAALFAILLYGTVKMEHLPKTAKLNLSLAFFMLPPLLIEPVNRMWHTGSYMSFPARYSFMLLFLLLASASDILRDLDPEIKPYYYRLSQAMVPLLLLALALLYAFFSVLYVESNISVLDAYTQRLHGTQESFSGLLMLFLFTFLLYLLMVHCLYKKKISTTVFTLLMAMVMFVNGYTNVRIYMSTGSYEDHVHLYKEAVDLSSFEAPEEATGQFYRVKLQKKYFDVNLMGGIGFNTTAHYTSLNSRDYIYAMKKLGYSSYWMEVGSYGGTAISDAALSNAYTVTWIQDKPKVYYNDMYQISQTPDYLPLGILTGTDLSNTNDLYQTSRYEVQRMLASQVINGDADGILQTYEPISKQRCDIYQNEYGSYELVMDEDADSAYLIYRIDVEGDQTLYFDCFNTLSTSLRETINGSFDIYVNGLPIAEGYPSSLNNGILELGEFKDEVVNMTIHCSKSLNLTSFGVFGVDMDALSEAVDNTPVLNLRENSDHRSFSASSSADSDQYVFLSLPFDKGLHAEIDGKEVALKQCFMGFTYFELPAGEHEISIRYTPPGLVTGLLVSAAAAVLMLLYALLKPLRNALERFSSHKVVYTICLAITYAGFVFVLGVIYVMPVILNLIGKI